MATKNGSSVKSTGRKLLAEKNPPFPKKPVAISIKGCHATIMHLDPRRVRPLPKQPRWESSPGFSEESLRGLGRSIRATRQLESVKVCLTNEPGYDAQLYDGERRLHACLLAGVMIRVEVCEKHMSLKELYLLSVVANNDKERHTALETAHSIKRFRSEEFKMSVSDIADIYGKSTPWVYQYLNILKLAPEVQELLVADPFQSEDVAPENAKKTGRAQKFALSFALVANLCDLPHEDQKILADKIVKSGMSLVKARRLILLHRNETDQHKAKRGRSKEQFESLEHLVRMTIEKIGLYEDMKPAAILEFLNKRDVSARRSILRELKGLELSINTLVGLVKRAVPG